MNKIIKKKNSKKKKIYIQRNLFFCYYWEPKLTYIWMLIFKSIKFKWDKHKALKFNKPSNNSLRNLRSKSKLNSKPNSKLKLKQRFDLILKPNSLNKLSFRLTTGSWNVSRKWTRNSMQSRKRLTILLDSE